MWKHYANFCDSIKMSFGRFHSPYISNTSPCQDTFNPLIFSVKKHSSLLAISMFIICNIWPTHLFYSRSVLHIYCSPVLQKRLVITDLVFSSLSCNLWGCFFWLKISTGAETQLLINNWFYFLF